MDERINAKLRVDVSNGTRLVTTNNIKDQMVTYDGHWLDHILAQTEVRNIRDPLIRVESKNSQYYANNAELH